MSWRVRRGPRGPPGPPGMSRAWFIGLVTLVILAFIFASFALFLTTTQRAQEKTEELQVLPSKEEVDKWLRSLPQGWEAHRLAAAIKERWPVLHTRIETRENVKYLFIQWPCGHWNLVTYQGLLEPPPWFTP